MSHSRNIRADKLEFLDAEELALIDRHRLAVALDDVGDEQHVGAVTFEIKPVVDLFPQH